MEWRWITLYFMDLVRCVVLEHFIIDLVMVETVFVTSQGRETDFSSQISKYGFKFACSV